MAKKVLTEQDIIDVVRKGESSIVVGKDVILTPSAKDAIANHKLKISSEQKKSGSEKPTASPSYQSSSITPSHLGLGTIVIGSDHGGYKLKKVLIAAIEKKGYRVVDIGTMTEEACDYPDFAYAVARIVAKGEADRGIMIDATGVASAIVCNKVPGVRAAACYNEFVAQSSREHNDANVLTLGAKALGEATVLSIVDIWLETWFGGGRHKKRVDKIRDIEQKFSR